MIVRQAANVLELLEFFVRRKEPTTLSEIADSLGWPRSSTFNLIQTLVDRGHLYEPRPCSGYYPSPALVLRYGCRGAVCSSAQPRQYTGRSDHFDQQ